MSQDTVTVEASSAKPKGNSVVSSAKLIGAITFLSRILGMARESIAANYFGANVVYSAFTFAFTVPNLFRKLLGEGALSAAFIPLYAQAVKAERSGASDLPANDFAAASVNLLCAILLGLTVIGEAILVLIVLLIPMRPDRLLAMQLTIIMLPYVLMVCGAAFIGSILQVHERFAAITFTAVVSNVCLIVAMIAAARIYDLNTDAGQIAAVRWLSFSVLVAGVVQILILLPSLRAVGFRFRAMLHFMTPAVRKMVQMTIPVALGAGVLQVSTLLDKSIAFYLSREGVNTHMTLLGYSIWLPMAEGATQRLNWAQYLYQFPLGVFAIALATAIFPKLSADAHDPGREQFKAVLRQGVQASLFIGLPASVGMIVVRYPAVQFLFQHGNFTAEDTRLVALSTAIYSAAIWAFSLQQILNRAYYALHDTTAPLIWGIVNLVMNIVIEIPLLWTSLGESAMAVGTLVSFALQAIAMLWILDRRVGGLGLTKNVGPIIKMILATLLMWIICVVVQHLPIYPHGERKLIWACQLALTVLVGGLSYFAACAAMGLDVTTHIRRRARPLKTD
ncbi:MAG TPA: murein biosynthesis integral membrane protein MurJ [Tepidisphaeraceae bacterium]|nr:murein biosynthesis integral membrane protein MurJ [Tepidisphaeraceae bacterium]